MYLCSNVLPHLGFFGHGPRSLLCAHAVCFFPEQTLPIICLYSWHLHWLWVGGSVSYVTVGNLPFLTLTCVLHVLLLA
jgi:hypothetical protein